MNVLVTGGAGYIGSHVARHLADAGHRPVVLDNLGKGHREAVAGLLLVEGDIGDRTLVERVLREERIEAVVHLAADCLVGESVAEPGKYFRNNVVNGLALADAMVAAGVLRLVFSSTAAVYGEPETTPITEDHPKSPTNPYGLSKLTFERILSTYDHAYGLRYTALRYFNAAGADPAGRLGEDHDPESHLIPIVLQVASGQRPSIRVFGTDYPTPDGTCVRDYVHVADLASAHRLALERLAAGAVSGAFNLGTGHGYSIREVVEAAERVTGRQVPCEDAPRRPGDPAVLVASSERARQELGWEPRHGALDTIIETAWRWHVAHPRGYA